MMTVSGYMVDAVVSVVDRSVLGMAEVMNRVHEEVELFIDKYDEIDRDKVKFRHMMMDILSTF